jgi:hypothetical protein
VRRSWRALAACMALLLAAGCSSMTLATSPVRASATAPIQPAPVTSRSAPSATSRSARPAAATLRPGRAPSGFWSGSDSWPVPVSGSGPYREPGIGGAYGGYIGMTGSWSSWLGCHGGFLAWSSANSAQADRNYATYGQGIGTAVYWFMGGPGVDPGYNGTQAEAAAWGARQAARTLANMAKEHVTYPVVFMDIELPGVAPAFDNGWDDVYTSPCSGVVKHHGVPAVLARADFNGFFNYVSAHSSYKVGVYSNAATWTQIFGTGAAGAIPHTYEWTYEPETAHLSDAPRGWCLKSGGCAQFFGGVTSSSARALMWQWSGGGGVRNAIGDLDQIDATRQS